MCDGLRTPMTSIGGFIDSILDGAIPPEKEKYYLEIVSSEIKRLSRLVTSLLEVSRMESGKNKLNLDAFDICEMARTILISNEQRKAAWDTAMRNGGDLRKHIILPRNYNSKKERMLKFCPCCLLDQDTPYYSVAHQYKEASVCPVCGCHLRETAIRADSAHLGVFHPLAGESLSTGGEYLTFRLRGTKYLLGIRGGKKDMEGMHRDLTKYYEGLPNNSLTLAHLKFIFQDEMCNPYEICMIGMFLGIEPEDLARYGEKPIRPLSEEADERIMALYKQGRRFSEIAELLQCPRETVRKVVLRNSSP